MALALSPLGPSLENLHFLELTLLYKKIRSFTTQLCSRLEVEDAQIQSMPEVSPPKWHLAHTTWFFEKFLLMRMMPDYQPFHPGYHYLFNSYYEGLGPHVERSRRGLLSRPTLREICRYREWVDSNMLQLLSSDHSAAAWEDIRRTLTLGVHHEQQHQELLLMDIKHILWSNPLRPAFSPRSPQALDLGDERSSFSHPMTSDEGFVDFPGGVQMAGFDGEGFAFDNEKPAHREFLEPYRLGSRLVTNGEYLEFIEAGGYRNPLLWLSDGWTERNSQGWEGPLYWERSGSSWQVFTLAGMLRLDPAEPVCHVSYYEADAYARWKGARLPTEIEWEVAARQHAAGMQGLIDANFADTGRYQPSAPAGRAGTVQQILGDVWEWTASPYRAYPGYQPFPGDFAEYNGKFMINQMVLRGGSCATPREHIRVTYRNFFSPASRWVFSGVRLAL